MAKFSKPHSKPPRSPRASGRAGKAGPAKAARAEFDGSRQRRRLSGWVPTSSTINALVANGGKLLRNRARDIVRNDPYAASACESFVANLIGAGVKPSSLIKDKDLRKQVHDTWLAWTDEADADGLCDLYGLQAMAARAVFEAGEVFIRFRPRRPEDGFTVPLQLQALESDLLDYGDNRTLANGNVIMNGVEFDLLDRRVAYHFYRSHPGDAAVEQGGVRGSEKVRVPASEVLHVFRPTRPGQVRGTPLVAPALVKLFLLHQYDDAELDRKKVAALYAGFIKTPTPEDTTEDPDVRPGETPGSGIVTLEPGAMHVLAPGEEVEFSAPAEVGGSYEAFQYRNLLAVFSAMGVPYTLGTGDLKRANYSSLRGAIVEYRRRLEQLQHQLIAFQMCRPIWLRWMRDAVISQSIPISVSDFLANRAGYTNVKWIAPKFEWVDPLKDQTAELLAVRAGFKSVDDVIEEMGEDPDETFGRIASANRRADDQKLVLDSDPRKLSRAGLTQARAPGAALPDVDINETDDDGGRDADAA